MNSTTDKNINIVEMNNEPKVKFRLFNKLDHSWRDVPEAWGDSSFLIRPMKHSERSRFKDAKSIVAKSRNIEGAIIDSGVDQEVLRSTSSDPKEKAKQAIATAKVFDLMNVDIEAEATYQEEVKRVIVACVKSCRVGEDEEDFTEEIYEEIDSDFLRMWLLGQIEDTSELSADERAGLS